MPTTLLEKPASLGQLPLASKVILMMDWVESVVHMENDEAAAVARWHRFALDAAAMIHGAGGCVVKSLGDGLLAVFDDTLAAAGVAQRLHRLAAQSPSRAPSAAPMYLRIGINKARVYACEFDVLGKGVNLTARLLTLAGPGETITTRGVRDDIAAATALDLEDLGDCHVKHIAEPIRAYRLGPAGERPVLHTSMAERVLRPSITVLPFVARRAGQEAQVLGAWMADAVSAELSRRHDIRVIPVAGAEAVYRLSGSYVTTDEGVVFHAELVSTRKNEIIWADRLVGELSGLCTLKSPLASALAGASMRALVDAEVRDLRTSPFPRLDSGSMLLGAVALMQGATQSEFELSRRALETVVERHSRIATPRAWLALWHVIRVVRGWSTSAVQDTEAGHAQARRVLAQDPGHPVAQSVEAYVHRRDNEACIDASAWWARLTEAMAQRSHLA